MQLKIRLSIFNCAKVEPLEVYFKSTLNILHLKIILLLMVILKCILGKIVRNVHCE